MNPGNVSIVDQFGNLLSNAPDDPDQVLADSQLEYRMKLENIYRNRIQSLVTPIVGSNNVNAQVNLEIDFTRREVSQEIVDPDGSATLSEQNSLNVTAKKMRLESLVLFLMSRHRRQQLIKNKTRRVCCK